MKLLGFLQCYGKAIGEPRSVSSPRTDESRAVRELSCAGTGSESPEQCKSKTDRKTGRNPVAGSRWQTSLDAISEDKAAPVVVGKGERVVVVVGKGERTVRSRKDLAGKAPSTAKKHVPVKRKEYRHVVVPVPVPTFSPMGFLF